jgi:hypothetical protein
MHGGAVTTYGRISAVHGKSAMANPDERPRTYGAGRVCTADGCDTVLSSYNPSSVCCLHNQGWTVHRRSIERHAAGRPELVGTCRNPQCGQPFVTTNPAKKYCCDRCRMQAFQRRAMAGRGRTVAA